MLYNMKTTIFRKVYALDRLPDYSQRVIGLVLEQNDLGLSKYLWNVEYDDYAQLFKFEGGKYANIEYWLEEIELPSEQDLRKESLGKFSEEEAKDEEIGDYIEEEAKIFIEGANYILNKLK